MRTERNREWDRQKAQRRKTGHRYGRVRRAPSKRGVIACVSACILAVILIAMIAYAYATRGKAPGLAGGVGLCVVIWSAVSLITAIRGFRERDKNYSTCKVGTGAHLVILAFTILIFIRGIL